MIKANELRSGNAILSAFDRIETVRMILGHENYKERKDVHKIYKHAIGVEENLNTYNLAEIKPIKLTIKRIKQLGFIKIKEGYYKGNYELTTNRGQTFIIEFARGELSIYFCSDSPCMLKHIDSVHRFSEFNF